MWPIFNVLKNGSPADAEQQRGPLLFSELASQLGDFNDFLKHDTDLKFWIPEPAEQALNEIAKRNELTMSEFLRQFFAIHCYGLYTFYVMKDKHPRLFMKPFVLFQEQFYGELSHGKKRIKTYWVPELGKNIAPIKVWMPAKLKNDLNLLATHANLTLSNYSREILVSGILGHGMIPTRPEMLQAIATPHAVDWIEGRDVPWREVGQEEADKHLISEIRPKIVDEELSPPNSPI